MLCHTCFAQLTYVRSLTVNDGLPQGQVRGLVQDKQGFMWIATEGLSRYDGRNFLNFTHAYGDSTTIASNSIHDLEIDAADSLWLVHDNREIDVLNPVVGRVRHISSEPAFHWMVASGSERITIRQAGTQLFVVNGNRVIVFDTHTGRHQPIPLPNGETVVAIGSHLNKALLATQVALYEIKEAALHRVVSFPPMATAAQFNESQSSISNRTALGKIFQLAQHNLVIGIFGGVVVYNEQTGGCRYYAINSKIITRNLTKAIDDNVYFIDSTGISKLQGDGMLQRVYTNTAGEVAASPLLADRSGMLWVGALIQGLKLFSLQTGNFYTTPIQRGFALDIASKWLPGLPQDVRFYSYALRTAKDATGTIWLYNQSSFYSNSQKSVLHTSDFYHFDGNKLDKLPFTDTAYAINGFTFDKWNRCWMLLFYRRINKVLLAKADIARHTIYPFAILPSENVMENSYLTSIDGRMVTLQEHTLRLYDTATAACTIYTLEKLGIGGTLLMALPDRKNKKLLWIATKGSGIVKLNIATGAVQHYTEAEGLPNNVVYYIAPDKKGFFWCSSNKGLFRFNPADGSVVAFTVKDGLQGNEFNRYHFLETPDGHFWFGGTEGHTVFHPDSVFLDHYQTPVVLTGLLVNNTPLQKLSPNWKNSLVSNLNSIILPYNQNQLSFAFAGLQYNAPEKLQYRYRLAGVNDSWVYAGYDARANYAAIPPGRYTLQVNVSNTAGQWSRYIKTLEVIITPPWWRTWWMYCLYAAVIIAAAFFYFRSRLRRLQLRQQVVLKQKEAEQAQALEETKSRFFANITHELRTPLTLILSPVQRQLQQGASTYSPQLLKGVYHNSQMLLRLINQLLDMSKLEAGNLPLNLHRGQVAAFIKSLLPPFQQQAAARSICFLFSVNEERETEQEHLFDSDKPHPAPVPPAPVRVPTNRNAPGPSSAPVRVVTNRNTPSPQLAEEGIRHNEQEHLFDSDKLEKVLYNLLSNAFKFTPDGGKIQVTGSWQSAVGRENRSENNFPIHSPGYQPGEATGKNIFQIQVSDTGIGIPPEHLPHIFDRFYQVNTSTTRRYEGTGIGLSLVKEFVDLMGGQITVESNLGTGSTFTLILPMAVASGSKTPVAPPRLETAETVAAIKEPPENEKADKPLVLVVDDNEQLRHFIQSSLQPHYRVLTAANGEEGLQAAIAELPELIISDVMMPVMDGYEFCQRIKENLLTSHIGFILLTAKTANESRVSGLRLGADHYLGKPFIVEELLLTAANLLKRQQQLRNLYSNQLQQPAEKLPPVTEVADEFLRSVYAVIDTYLDSEKLDVDFLAGELAVSRRTLNRKLATVADTSASEIIRHYRLKKAAGLLQSGRSVSEAAYATGFSTPSYFSQCFKDLYSVSPAKFAGENN